MNYKKISVLLILYLIILFINNENLFTIEISIELKIYRENNNFFIKIKNIGKNPFYSKSLIYYFNKKQISIDLNHKFELNEEKIIALTINKPELYGSYNLYCKLIYLNDDELLSVVANELFDFNKKSNIEAIAKIITKKIYKKGKISIEIDNINYLQYIKLILPEELEIENEIKEENKITYSIINNKYNFHNNYKCYFIIEKNEYINNIEIHSAGYFTVELSTGKSSDTISFKNFNIFNFKIILILLFLFLILFIFFLIKYFYNNDKYIRLLYLLFSYFIVTFFVFIFQFPGLFIGNNYSYFRNYILPFYYVGILLYQFYSYIKLKNSKNINNQILEKKIWLVFTFCYAFIHKLINPKMMLKYNGFEYNWNSKTKTAILSLLVKFIFMPLLWSWTINNTFHIYNIIKNQNFDFFSFNKFLIDIFILLDTFIFAFSYSIESKKLKSKIRSVEPTILGWIVCLACYPPLNSYSFKWISELISLKININLNNFTEMIITVIITILWAIYLSATFALGPKASNLTNRGIISSGPYRIIRHPAYISKNLVWLLEFLFFNSSSLGNIIGVFIIYYLRAITEERHLKNDPEYINYMKFVRYKFIPGII